MHAEDPWQPLYLLHRHTVRWPRPWRRENKGGKLGRGRVCTGLPEDSLYRGTPQKGSSHLQEELPSSRAAVGVSRHQQSGSRRSTDGGNGGSGKASSVGVPITAALGTILVGDFEPKPIPSPRLILIRDYRDVGAGAGLFLAISSHPTDTQRTILSISYLSHFQFLLTTTPNRCHS